MASKNINDLESLTSISGSEIFPVSIGNGGGTKKVSMATVKSYCSSGIVSSGGSSIDLSSVPSDIIPNQDSSYYLGSSEKAWKNVYSDNIITPSISNDNKGLTIDENTEIRGDLRIDQNLETHTLNSRTITPGEKIIINGNAGVIKKGTNSGEIFLGNGLNDSGVVISSNKFRFNGSDVITESTLDTLLEDGDILSPESIVDDLLSTTTNQALSANQGRELNTKIASVENSLNNKISLLSSDKIGFSELELDSDSREDFIGEISGIINCFHSEGNLYPLVEEGVQGYVQEYVAENSSGGSSNITIDNSLSSLSTNPVQNKIITAALNDKQNIISDITTIRSNAETAFDWGDHGSAGYATETYVQEYVANNAGSNITVDSSLSNSSTNPVQNKVITTALNEKLSKKLSLGTAITAPHKYNGSEETVIEFPTDKNTDYSCYKSIFGSTNSILTLKSNHDPIVEITGQKNTYTLMHSGNNLPRLDYGTIITVSYSRMAKIILKDYDNGGTTKTNIDLSKCKIVLLKFKSIPDYDNVETSSTTPIPSDNPTSTGQATNEINYYEKTVFVALSPTSTGSLTDIDNWTTNANPSKTIIGYLRFPGCDFYNQYKYTNSSTSGGNSIFEVSARTNLNLINNYNPSLGQFCTYAESTISAYGFEVGTSTASDANLKNIIGEVNLSLDQIANAPAIQFTWKNGINNRINAGTIAQYWREVLPEVVHGEDGSLSMNYGATALISAISLAKTITKQNEEIKLLKEEIENLKNKS